MLVGDPVENMVKNRVDANTRNERNCEMECTGWGPNPREGLATLVLVCSKEGKIRRSMAKGIDAVSLGDGQRGYFVFGLDWPG